MRLFALEHADDAAAALRHCRAADRPAREAGRHPRPGLHDRHLRSQDAASHQLGASKDGRLMSLCHEGWEVTSRPNTYNVSGTESTARAYACPNILTRVNIVHVDRNTPGFMRAPPDTPYMFPLECAMDELALALAMNPIELRRRNEPAQDPVTGLAFSSRHF